MLALRIQHPRTVLVVDDEAVVRATATAMLRGYYRVLQAADAATALQMAHRARPDVVVTDVNMPHMGGYELAIALREWRADQPILFVSGFVATESVQRALSSRAISFIEKPFSQEDLLEAISSLLPPPSAGCGRDRRHSILRQRISPGDLPFGLKEALQ